MHDNPIVRQPHGKTTTQENSLKGKGSYRETTTQKDGHTRREGHGKLILVIKAT